MNPLGSPSVASTRKPASVQSIAPEPRLDYARVIKLFVSEHTAELEDRQMAAVRRVVRMNADG
jgi:hypothetical protein